MSAHAPEHDAHGQDAHGAAEGHGEHWGDYNAAPPRPNNLAPIQSWALAFFGLALVLLLSMIVRYSFRLATATPVVSPPETPHAAPLH